MPFRFCDRGLHLFDPESSSDCPFCRQESQKKLEATEPSRGRRAPEQAKVDLCDAGLHEYDRVFHKYCCPYCAADLFEKESSQLPRQKSATETVRSCENCGGSTPSREPFCYTCGYSREPQSLLEGTAALNPVHQEGLMDDLNVLRSRFRGCLLGGAVGDALGMPTEVGPSRRRGQLIREACGVDWVQTYRDSPNPKYLQAGQYTDDTQQTICLAETLLASDGHFNAELFFRKLTRAVERFHRGVGPSTKRVMGAIRNGALKALLRGEAASQSPTNGGAMRVAPVAMVYFWDPDRLMRIAQDATRATHAHPTSVAGACVQALLVAAAVREGSDLDFGQLRDDVSERIKDLDPELASLIHRSAVPLEDGMRCRVMDTVPAVARAFLANSDDFSTGVLAQVNSEGDTDTKAAMLGQLIGAQSGIESIPSKWLQGLEDGHRGRTYLTLLADALLLLALRVRSDASVGSHTG